ncbi:proteasome regulatory particle subunit [Chamberlinius hualienensis]
MPGETVVTDGDRIMKMEVDYSSTCDEKIPQCQQLAKEGKLSEAIAILLSLEKQARTGADAHSTSRILVTIVQLCFQCKDWNALYENVALLSKRRSQIKMAVTKMVQECCTYVDQMPDKENTLKLIETLQAVTAGKIYVEVERARLTHKLALMKEAEGKYQDAALILQELQVETFGSMEKKEKVQLILEQMRLCLARKDFIRTQIISKKINTKFFDDEGTEELKLKYYRLMIDLDQHDGSYLAISKHYRAIYDTPSVQADAEKKHRTLKCVVLYLVLASYDNEQHDLVHRVKQEKALEDIPRYQELLQLFVDMELIKWSALCENYEIELRKGPTDVFVSNNADGDKRWKDLKIRVVEHNIRIIAKYYTRIRLERMAQLLDLSENEAEEFLCGLVVNKMVEAKMDRPAKIINFSRPKKPNDVLNEWTNNTSTLMQLVSKTTHLINKEEMIYKHMNVSSATSAV